MPLFTGVVVIDDAPEVTIDDPNFLFDSNEGFQEVTSKKAFKSKQKAQLEAELRQKLVESKKSAAKVRNSSLIKDMMFGRLGMLL